MNTIKNNLIAFALGAFLMGTFVLADFTEQEIISTAFTPIIQDETNETTTTIARYNFDIKTIKYFPEQRIDNTIMIPTLIGTTTVDVATTTITIVPAKYDYATTTHTKTISSDEYNFCRETKSEKTCKAEIDRIVAESREYHLTVAKAEMEALQNKLKRTDYFQELSTQQEQQL